MMNGTSAAAPSVMDRDDPLPPQADRLTTVDWLTFKHGLNGMLIISCSYWTAVLLYMAIPRLFPHYSARYKLQNTPLSPQQRLLDSAAAPSSPSSSSKGDHNKKNGSFFFPPAMMLSGHARGVLLVLFNQVVVSSLFNLTVYQLRFWAGRSIPIHFPSDWLTVFVHFFQYMVCFEIMFYWSHRLLHTKYLYRSIHSVHHRYKAPVPYCAACVHPIEFILSYMAPNVLPAVCFGHSVAEVTLFVAFEAFHTVHDHCGYHYPRDPFTLLCQQNAAVHDEHHRLLKVNYSGAFTMYMDRLFGTYYEPQPRDRHHHENIYVWMRSLAVDVYVWMRSLAVDVYVWMRSLAVDVYVWMRSLAVDVSRTWMTSNARPLLWLSPLIIGGQTAAAAGRTSSHNNNKEL